MKVEKCTLSVRNNAGVTLRGFLDSTDSKMEIRDWPYRAAVNLELKIEIDIISEKYTPEEGIPRGAWVEKLDAQFARQVSPTEEQVEAFRREVISVAKRTLNLDFAEEK